VLQQVGESEAGSGLDCVGGCGCFMKRAQRHVLQQRLYAMPRRAHPSKTRAQAAAGAKQAEGGGLVFRLTYSKLLNSRLLNSKLI
jgi:hypothetical protein